MNDTKRMSRKDRETSETRIRLNLCLDGAGASNISTGVGFLDHMLHLLASHARFDLDVDAEGDLGVDAHHTTEDVGIVLGDAFREALADKAGINRFADVSVPMQDSLVSVAVDICGRPHLTYDVLFPTEKIGDFDTNLIEEFFYSFASHAGITLHVHKVRGENPHHIAEAAFKAAARALRRAVAIDPDFSEGVPSTKGLL